MANKLFYYIVLKTLSTIIIPFLSLGLFKISEKWYFLDNSRLPSGDAVDKPVTIKFYEQN